MYIYVKKLNQKGRSMIEMLGVLAIVGILSAGGIAGYSKAMQSYKTNALIEKIQLIAQAARTVYKGNYKEINGQDLIDSGKISDVNNPFGGQGLFIYSSLQGNEYFSIRIPFRFLPAETCVDLITTDWGHNGVFWGIRMSGNGNNATFFKWNDDTYPVETADAITECKEGDYSSITLDFK
jgi:prepilin-type N-terminal cleavage/methylation domain-containing protein